MLILRRVKKLVLPICSLLVLGWNLVLWWNISEIGAEHVANERLHIVTVFDEARTSHARAMITSVLLSTKSTVHVHMVVPDDVRDEMSSWFQTLDSVFKPGTVLLSTYDYRWCVEWTGLLLHISPHIHISAHCKFFLQEILLDVEKALYIDLDVAGVGDISELFNHDETGYIGMSIDTGSLCQRFPEKCAWPIPFSTVVPGGLVCGEQPDKLRYLQPNYTCPEDYGLTPLQFNGGVVMLHLHQMRNENFTTSYIDITVSTWLDLDEALASFGEQDFINNYFRVKPEALYVLPCGANYQSSSSRRSFMCSNSTVYLAHAYSYGLRGAKSNQFLKRYEKLKSAWHCGMKQCTLDFFNFQEAVNTIPRVRTESFPVDWSEFGSVFKVYSPDCPHQKLPRLNPSVRPHGLGDTVYIITRTDNRPNFFTENAESITRQTYSRIVHLVIRDERVTNYVSARSENQLSWNPEEGFALEKRRILLQPSDSVMDSMKKFDSQEPCRVCDGAPPLCDKPKDYILFDNKKKEDFNKCYCNTSFPMNRLFEVAHEYIQSDRGGWVVYLDDDNYLFDKTGIAKLLSKVHTSNNLYAFRALLGRPTPREENFGLDRFIPGDIDTGNFLFHSSKIHFTNWSGQRCGDLRTALSLSSGLPISWPLGVGDFLQGSHPLRRQAGGMGTMGDFKKISVVICTFELGARFDLVVNNMRKLQSSEMKALVDRIILVWNNPDIAAPEIDGVMVLSATKNSMNNRWILPLPYIRTDAVLVLDDDLLVSKDGILCLYRWWCLYPERPVGTFARRIETRDDSYEYVMSELFGDREIDSKGAYNIILPRIMFLSKNLMSKYAATSKKLLDYVDDQGAHCDDILLNTLSIKDSGTIGLRVVLPRDSVVDCYDIGFQRGLDGFHGLSNTKGGNRTAMRKQCSKFVIEELLTGKELPLATKVGVCAPDWKGKSAGGNSLTEASQVQSDRWKQTLISSELGLGICKLL